MIPVFPGWEDWKNEEGKVTCLATDYSRGYVTDGRMLSIKTALGSSLALGEEKLQIWAVMGTKWSETHFCQRAAACRYTKEQWTA